MGDTAIEASPIVDRVMAQFPISRELHRRVAVIAARNGLSRRSVMLSALAVGLSVVESDGRSIPQPKGQAS